MALRLHYTEQLFPNEVYRVDMELDFGRIVLHSLSIVRIGDAPATRHVSLSLSTRLQTLSADMSPLIIVHPPAVDRSIARVASGA